jgi:hypothetical protein
MKKETYTCDVCGFEITDPLCKPGWTTFVMTDYVHTINNESYPGMQAFKGHSEGRKDFCSKQCHLKWVSMLYDN